jgi:aminopeptidase N
LKKHAYGNATTEDLWNALSDASGVRVRDNMELWIKHVGYPVLTVREEKDGLCIKQSRFISTGDATAADQNLWWVPLGLKSEKATTHQQSNVLEKEKHIDIRPFDSTCYKLNDSASGVYRVNYPPSRLEILGKQISAQHPLLNASDRISLVADAAALAISGEGSTTGFLALAENFKQESSYFVWDELLKRLSQLQSAWYEQPEDVIHALRTFSKNLIEEKFAEIGWEGKPDEDYLTSQLRPSLIKEASFARIPGYPIDVCF